jgi:hypothetical protein
MKRVIALWGIVAMTVTACSFGSPDKACMATVNPIGMQADDLVKTCWGEPTSVNTTRLPGHVQSQWIYKYSTVVLDRTLSSYSYVYLDNGIVTGVQTSR